MTTSMDGWTPIEVHFTQDVETDRAIVEVKLRLVIPPNEKPPATMKRVEPLFERMRIERNPRFTISFEDDA